MTMTAPASSPSSVAAAPPQAQASARFGHVLRSRIAQVRRIPDLLRRRRELKVLFDARAELGYDLLAGRVDLDLLKSADAEAHLQGLDVIECRDLRLLEILAFRAERPKRCPWRLSPEDRACRKQANTPAGRRQREWLNLLEEAGLLGFRDLPIA